MKPRRISLRGAASPPAAASRILKGRLSEAAALAGALVTRHPRGLHDLRIACKRMRYALERFEAVRPGCAGIADAFAEIQDALGEVHDRDVLLAELPPQMKRTRARLHAERDEYAARAAQLWPQLVRRLRDFDPDVANLD